MPRIAIIQDGTELARQTYADTSCFRECCTLLSEDGTNFEPRVFTDEAVKFLLDGIDPEEYACVVFASNALLSGMVGRVLTRCQEDLQRYLSRGGGIVVLHQIIDSLALVLPEKVRPEITDRETPERAGRATALDPEDILLQYPNTVSVELLRDGVSPSGPPSLFYKTFHLKSLPESLKPVLACGREILLTRTYDHVPERVVVAVLPLDWQCEKPLLTNAIRYACLGSPRRLVWLGEERTHTHLLRHWLCMDGRTSIRSAPKDGEPIGEINRWLLANVGVFVVPPDHLNSAKAQDEVIRFLERGGTLITADPATDIRAGGGAGPPVSRITALVGESEERNLVSRLYGELRAVRGWDTVQYAFELRNILSALSFLWEDPVNRTAAAISPQELGELKDKVCERLWNGMHRQDLSSSIALAQTLTYLEEPAKVDPELVDWMLEHPRARLFDVHLQIIAVIALGRREAKPEFLAQAYKRLRQEAPMMSSLAQVARVLDAVAVLHQARLLGNDVASAKGLAEQVCCLLVRFPDEPEVGWMSVEATADITRGLVALSERLPPNGEISAHVSEHIAKGVIALRRALCDYERNPKGVAWLARLSHALIPANRRFPIGLQYLASLEWPGQLLDTAGGTSSGLSLLDYLARENKNLREKERLLQEQQLAGKIGRGTITICVTMILLGLLVPLIVVMGLQSLPVLVGNIGAILGMLFLFLPGAYILLQKWHLCAAPAQKVIDWSEKYLVPLASGIGKLKRQ